MRRSTLAETDNEPDLISLATTGNRDAFGRLYERYRLRVLRHALFLTGDPILAEDITEQTFLNALQAIPRYQARGVPFVAWLLRITYNLTINHKKSARTTVTPSSPRPSRPKAPPTHPRTPAS